MTLQQVADLRAEGDELNAFLETIPEDQWARETPFKNRTIDWVVQHLHDADRWAVHSVTDPDGFRAWRDQVRSVPFETPDPLHGRELLDRWRSYFVELCDALEAADNGALGPFVKLVVDLQKQQFVKATTISEAARNKQDSVAAILSGLTAAAQKTAEAGKKDRESVAETALQVSSELRHWLESHSGEIRSALQRVYSTSEVRVAEADDATDHYFRSQIVENARDRLGYFANLGEFRHWVSLNMAWRRRAKLVFAIHGLGREFNGTLVCAPFLEFRDNDEDGVRQSGLVPVAEEGFLFFHNETLKEARQRFTPWRDAVFGAAMRELTGNL